MAWLCMFPRNSVNTLVTRAAWPEGGDMDRNAGERRYPLSRTEVWFKHKHKDEADSPTDSMRAVIRSGIWEPSTNRYWSHNRCWENKKCFNILMCEDFSVLLECLCVCLCACWEVGNRVGGGGSLTTDFYCCCLICQTLLALWVFNLLIRPQDPCLFPKTTALMLICCTRLLQIPVQASAGRVSTTGLWTTGQCLNFISFCFYLTPL